MRLKCALCGKPTAPFAFIGAMAVGPKCSKKLNLSRKTLPKGAAIRFAKSVKLERGPKTIDLFSQLEDHDL